jgi:universal stress protein A
MPTPEIYVTVDQMNDLVEQERLRVAKLALSMTGIPVDYQARSGAPGPEIVLVAEQIQADLIVMGTHGRSGISRILMGSIAEHVLRHAHCPVLTVKPGKSERMPTDEMNPKKVSESATEYDAAVR